MPDMLLIVDTAVVVPVNLMPLTDDTDFKTRETAVAYNADGMDLVWNFVTTAGVVTQTAVTPTTASTHDWTHLGDGMYTMEIPATHATAIKNDTEGYGWFTGYCTGVLPWRGPTIGFAPANVVNSLIAGSATLSVNATQISGDGTAADNLEADYDGTGYSKTNSLTPANVTQISGDATAADNAELAFDGTGFGFTGCTMPTVTTLTGHTAQTGDCFARLGAPAGASVSADVAAIKVDSAAILVDTDTTIPALINALNDLDAAGIRTALGLATANLDTQLAALAAYIDTEVAAILADTNELQTDWANGGRLDLLIDAIKVVTDALPDSGALTTLLTHLTDIKGTGFVKDTHSLTDVVEDTGTTLPATLSTISTAVTKILKWFTNKLTVTSSQRTLYDDDGTTPLYTQSHSDDDTTVTRDKAT